MPTLFFGIDVSCEDLALFERIARQRGMTVDAAIEALLHERLAEIPEPEENGNVLDLNDFHGF